MDQSDRIARRALEDEREARPVTYLSKLQKEVLRKTAQGVYEHSDGVDNNSPEAAALHSLQTLGLVSLRATKAGIGGWLTDKGRLLLHENPKLRFISEDQKWKSMHRLQIITILITLLGVIVTVILSTR